VAITATVRAGKQYQLDEIRFSELASGPATTSAAVVTQEAAFSAAELRALFPVQERDIFDTHKIQKGLEELRSAYAAKGFIHAVVLPRIQPDKTTERVLVTIEIDEGKQFHIGYIKVLGLDPLVTRPLLESSGLAFGNIFDPAGLDAFFRAITASLPEHFAVADYVERRINEEKSTVDLILRVPCPAP
jgi:outer membrane protein assembly factor BamA